MASPQLSDQWDWSFCSSQSFGSAKSIISVNSGLESQVSSNPNAPFEFLHTSESPDAAGTMSSCTGSKDHSSSQHFHPHPTDVNEWVQRQSIATQVPLKSKANSNGLPGATTKLSVPNSEVSGPLSGSLGKWSNVSQHSPSVYDIPTLLEIGTTTSSDHMELRIRPAALAEDIFKYKSHGGSSKSFEKSRHRGLSEDSDITHRSMKSEDEVVFGQGPWSYIRPPFRQPLSPPEKTSTQQHEGFKRFLKQVASPPHQRVTAGGRVVPAGPQSPPPMMNFGSIDANLSRPLAPKRSTRQINHPSESTDYSGISNTQPQLFVPPGGNIPSYALNSKTLNPPSQPAPNLWKPDSWDGNGPSYGNVPATLPVPVDMAPVIFLPAGEAVVLCNGVYSRVYHNGQNQFSEPVTTRPSFVSPPEQLVAVASQATHDKRAVPSLGGPNAQIDIPTRPSSRVSNQIRNDDPRKDYEKFRSQLSKLDRHMASHFHKLPQSELQKLAAQREWLVQQIDYFRVQKAKLATQLPTPSTQAYQSSGISSCSSIEVASPPATDTSNSIQQASKQAASYAPDVAQIDSTRCSVTRQRTCLSPDAPPFFPSTTATISDHSNLPNNLGNATKDETPNGETSTCGNDTTWKPIIVQTANAVGGLKNEMSANMDKKISRSLGNAEDDSAVAASSSSLLTYEDVEYVDRIGLNPPDGEKLVCSTIEEFQEVIRQVRMQAKLYGCQGGQSKDPEYDAEEDIHWAMKDNVPIPLPAMVPDHVLRPRPWDWNDSFFNPLTHKDRRYPIMSNRNPSPVTQEHSNEETLGPNKNLAVHNEEFVDPVREQLFREQLLRDSSIGLARPEQYETKPEAFGLDAATNSYNTPFWAKSSAFPASLINAIHNAAPYTNSGLPTVDMEKILGLVNSYSRHDKELKSYINDEFDPQFSDGGRYTVKYQELLFAVQYKDPHFVRRVGLLNPVWDTTTNELILADDGPPGYEKDMASYAEKYGEDEVKKNLGGLFPQNIHAVTSEGVPMYNFKPIRVRLPLKTSDGSSPQYEIVSSYDISDPAVLAKYDLSRFAGPNRRKNPYPPPNAMSDQAKSTSQTSPRKSGSTGSFLQGMLKSPQFSAQARKFIDRTPDEVKQRQMKMTEQMEKQMKITSVVDRSENADEKKENLESRSQHDDRATRPTRPPAFCSPVPIMTSRDVSLQKAQSSLASSNYNACGYLPQGNRAGAYLESSSNQTAGNSPQNGASRNHLSRPWPAPYTSKRGGTENHSPKSRGMGMYDGADDSHLQSRAVKENATSNASSSLDKGGQSTTKGSGSNVDRDIEQARPPFDYQGVTVDDFNVCGRVFAPGDHAAIARFFHKLRKQENEITARAQEAKPRPF